MVGPTIQQNIANSNFYFEPSRSITVAEMFLLNARVGLTQTAIIIANLNGSPSSSFKRFVEVELNNLKTALRYPKKLPKGFSEQYLSSEVMKPESRPQLSPKKTKTKVKIKTNEVCLPPTSVATSLLKNDDSQVIMSARVTKSSMFPHTTCTLSLSLFSIYTCK